MNDTTNNMHTSKRLRRGGIQCSCGKRYPNGNDWADHYEEMREREAAIRLACGCARVLLVSVARTGIWNVRCDHGITEVTMIEGGQFYQDADIEQRLEVSA